MLSFVCQTVAINRKIAYLFYAVTMKIVESFHEYYDEIEICQDVAGGHYKAAIQVRNREMVDRSDLVVCYIEHNSGGAFQTVQYAKKKNKEIVNLSDQ